MSTPTARFARTSTRGLILGFSALRAGAIATAAVLLVIGLVADGMTGLLVVSPLWGLLLAAAFVQVQGQPAIEWLPVATTFEGRKLAGQTEFRARPSKPRPAGTLALPGDAAALRFYEPPNGAVAMIHDPHRQTLSAVLSVTHPAYVLLSPDDQTQRVTGWGRVLASLANSGHLASIQILESTFPDGGVALTDWYSAQGQHTGAWFDAEYEALLALMHTGSVRHRTTITISLDMKKAAKAIAASGRGVKGASAVLEHEMVGLEQSLRNAGLRIEHWLRAPELAAIVRRAYDQATSIEPDAPGANLRHAGPMAVSEQWDRFRSDSGSSAVLWISEWPRIDVPPHFLHSMIFSPGVRKSISIVARPLPTREALKQIRRDKTEAVSDSRQKAKIGQIADLSDAQEYADLEARERALIQGHADVEFSGFIAVQAGSSEELTAAVSQIERAASQAACETRILYGRQTQGFVVAALPFGRTVS